MNIIQNLKYYFWASYYRKTLDKLLEKNKSYCKGVVLDVGGRNINGKIRGKFQPPRDRIEKWIFADIDPKNNPDVVLDVTDMHSIKDESIDTIHASNLFEHVNYPEKGILECQRVLKKPGIIIISVPFLGAIHADPFDYQRWTESKWKLVLSDAGLDVLKLIPIGGFFAVLGDMLKNVFKKTGLFRYLFYIIYPFLDIWVMLDKLPAIKKSELGKYVEGYFIISIKK